MFDQRAAALSGASATCCSVFDQSNGDALDDTLDFEEAGETLAWPEVSAIFD